MSHVQHRLDTGGFSEKAKSAESAESAGIFAIFGKSLGAFRHFSNANLSTFCTMFPLRGVLFQGAFISACGSKLYFSLSTSTVCVICTTLTGRTGGFSESAKSAESSESTGIFAIFCKILRGGFGTFLTLICPLLYHVSAEWGGSFLKDDI